VTILLDCSVTGRCVHQPAEEAAVAWDPRKFFARDLNSPSVCRHVFTPLAPAYFRVNELLSSCESRENDIVLA
jgi:hypothetical protein